MALFLITELKIPHIQLLILIGGFGLWLEPFQRTFLNCNLEKMRQTPPSNIHSCTKKWNEDSCKMSSGFLESGISGFSFLVFRQPLVDVLGWFGCLSCWVQFHFPSNVPFFTAFSHVPNDTRWNSLHDDELFSSSSAPNYDNAEQLVGGCVARMLYLMHSIGQNKSIFDLSVQRTLFQWS